MVRHKMNRIIAIQAIKRQLVNGRSVTLNPKHADWIIAGLERDNILLEISQDNKIKRRDHTIEDIKLDIPISEIRRYCMDRGVVIYPVPLNSVEYELVVEKQGMEHIDPGRWKQNPKNNESSWVDRVTVLYKQEYLKLIKEHGKRE